MNEFASLSERLRALSGSTTENLEYSLVLYDIPELYYAYLPHQAQVGFIDRLIEHFRVPLDQGILDLGCGGAQILSEVARCGGAPVRKVGVDAHAGMIEYGRKRFGNDVELHVGDVRTFRYGDQFSFVVCMGTVMQYARSNAELRHMVETMIAHIAPGGYVMVDIKNSATYLQGFSGLDSLLQERALTVGEFHGVKRSRHVIDLKRQTLDLFVDWDITAPVQTTITDHCSFRLIFPQELIFILESMGLEVLGMWDGFNFDDNDSAKSDRPLTGDRLMVVARLRGESATDR